MTLSFPISSTVRARGRTVDRLAAPGRVEFPVRYGLLFHPRQGPVLIDTGYTRELWAVRGMEAAIYRGLLAPKLLAAQDPSAVLERAGLRPADVRHVIVTHLHPDHISALGRFHGARIYASEETLNLWSARRSMMDGLYPLLRGLLPPFDSANVAPVESASNVALPWGGVGRDLFGDGTIVTLPLPGHVSGHLGVFFPERDIPILYGVDVAWVRSGYRHGRLPPVPLRAAIKDVRQAKESAEIVRRAERWGAVVVLCHDPEPLAAGL